MRPNQLSEMAKNTMIEKLVNMCFNMDGVAYGKADFTSTC